MGRHGYSHCGLLKKSAALLSADRESGEGDSLAAELQSQSLLEPFRFVQPTVQGRFRWQRLVGQLVDYQRFSLVRVHVFGLWE